MPSRVHLFSFVILIGFVLVSPGIAQVPTRRDVDDAQEVELPEDPAAVIAVVGQTPILYGDVSAKVEARIADVLAKTKQKIPEDQLHYARINLTRALLAEMIQNKMMRESFLLDQVGTAAADKRAEADATLQSRARQMFFESEVPELKKQYETDSLEGLDKKLREKGSTLASRQREFIDAMLGHLYIRSKVEKEPSVSIAEITRYYEENGEEYSHPTRARWEQLTVLFSKFPDRQSAYDAIWEMGREAYFGGNLQAVAREKSQEPLARSGGLHEWTEQGALASGELDKEIFSIELNAMSEIITDAQGFHIIRVLDRQLAGLTPLSQVQDEIRAKIRKDKIAKSRLAVMEDMRQRIPVWSLFPKDVPEAKPIPRVASRSSAQDQRKTGPTARTIR